MKSLVLAIAVLSASSSAFADQKAWNLMSAMDQAGASAIVVGDQSKISIEKVNCFSNSAGEAKCVLTTAVESDSNQPANDTMTAVGPAPKALIKALVAEGASSFSNQEGGITVRLSSATCAQPFQLDITKSEPEQTSCVLVP